jgi:cytochrome c oxidase cbb3-type subunit 2
MFTKGMNPKLENLKTYTALQLAGRDIYQREGCINCHSQLVRPLKADVLRYGEYSKAGEFAYERPFLWGSKRTGNDLARIGKKYPDEWHRKHFMDPRSLISESNMPAYPWLAKAKLDPESIKKHMAALNFPVTAEELRLIKDQTEMDAIIAYMQVLGTAVENKPLLRITETMVEAESPLKDKAAAQKEGQKIYLAKCAPCHGKKAEGGIGSSLVKYRQGNPTPKGTYLTIANGIQDAMPGFINEFSKDQIWSVVEYIQTLK